LILRELEGAVFVSIESKGVAGWAAALVDYEGDSAANGGGGKRAALANRYNSISINKVKRIVRRNRVTGAERWVVPIDP